MRRLLLVPALLAVWAGAAGASTTDSDGGPGALQAEANAAAAGDIPDNQVFLVFHNRGAGYSMKYPEGWDQRGSAGTVVFRDKTTIVRIVIAAGAVPTAATVRHELRGLPRVSTHGSPHALTLPGGRGLRVVYRTESAPNAVTGKRVTLVVD